MDEDQVNEQQGSNEPERQEVTFTEGSGRDQTPSRGMFSAVRRSDPVNLYSFLGKQNDDVNERITQLQSQITSLSNNNLQQRTNFEKSLVTINTSILTLQQGLKVVSDKLEVSDQLRKIRDANELKREQQLAQQQLREGKESLIEKKMQTTLSAPLQKIGAKAQSVLGGLLKFFNTILLGIIGTRGIQVLGALISGNKEKLEEIKGKILKELGVATGIFLAINGGLAIALRSVIRLTGFIGRVAFTNLLGRPLRRIFELAANGQFLRGANRGPGGTIIPPGKNKNNVKNNKLKNTSKSTIRSSSSFLPRGSSRFMGGFRAYEELMGGGDLVDVTIAGGVGTAVPGFISRLPIPSKYKIPLIFGMELFGGTDFLIDQTQNAINPKAFNEIGSNVQNRQLELRERANNVTVVGDNTEESNITSGSGQVNDASALMVVPSSNSDNPYILNSYMQYNVVM